MNVKSFKCLFLLKAIDVRVLKATDINNTYINLHMKYS